MRSVIWLLLLFGVAVAAATLLGDNKALVSVVYEQWRVDLSLNLFLLALIATIVLAYLMLRGVNSLLSLPRRAQEWRELKRERAAHASFRESVAEFLAGRYARAQRAADHAVALADELPALAGDAQLHVLGHLMAASSLHRMQDRMGRDDRLQAARRALPSQPQPGVLSDGVQLLAAEWALADRDTESARALLAELPPGTSRRTQALRLRMKAARHANRPLDALQTARLLAKHQGFSALAAQSLLRSLALQVLDQCAEEEQLRAAWQALDLEDRKDPYIAARAARRAHAMGHPQLGRQWLAPLWDDMEQLDADGRQKLALALIDCAVGLGSEWIARVETALTRFGHEEALVAASGVVLAERQLWGKARRPLELTAAALNLPGDVRRLALRRLGDMSRLQGDETAAARYEQRAAQTE